MSRWDQKDEVCECANCGAIEDLLRCSRCRAAWFCSFKCQKSYWPFHRSECKRNEFADAIEATEPKFASWMRSHGKQAVLKDDEVDRLERAAASTSVGAGRREMMDSMYGRIEPKPLPPTFDAAEIAAMEIKQREEARQLKLVSAAERAWQQLPAIPDGLGQDCGAYRWAQNQSHVHVHVCLPGRHRTSWTTSRRQAPAVHVVLQPGHVTVTYGSKELLAGPLYREIKVEGSLWFVDGGILTLQLLKRHRRGHYAGSRGTNADTFWRALLAGSPPHLTLPGDHPPTHYYTSLYEEEDLPAAEPVAPPLRMLPTARQAIMA